MTVPIDWGAVCSRVPARGIGASGVTMDAAEVDFRFEIWRKGATVALDLAGEHVVSATQEYSVASLPACDGTTTPPVGPPRNSVC